MGTYKSKAIQADLGISTHTPAYSGITRHIQELFKHIQVPVKLGIFRALAIWEPGYSELWYIQNLGIFRILVYSETWYIENQRHLQNPGIFKILAY